MDKGFQTPFHHIGLTKLRFVPHNDKARRQRLLNILLLLQKRARLKLSALSLRGTKQSVSLRAKAFKHPFIIPKDCFVPRNDKARRQRLLNILLLFQNQANTHSNFSFFIRFYLTYQYYIFCIKFADFCMLLHHLLKMV